MDESTTIKQPIEKQLFTRNFIIDPYPTYQYLTQEEPLVYVNLFGGAWLVSSHKIASKILKDYRFTNNTLKYINAAFEGEQKKEMEKFIEFHATWLPYLRNEQHTEVRHIMHRALEKAIDDYTLTIEGIASELLECLDTTSNFDFMSTYAYKFPAYAICEILGLEKNMIFKIIEWAEKYHRYISSDITSYEVGLAALRAVEEIKQYFDDLLIAPYRIKDKSLLSGLLQIEPKSVTRNVLIHQLTNFVIAGYVNSNNSIGNSMLALLRHPQQLQMLRSNPELYPTAVRELIRYDTSTQLIPREALETIDDYGKRIDKKELVFILVGAANRDPNVFDKPNQLNIERRSNPHLAFGYGPHTCIGLHLTYVTLEIALKGFFDYFKESQITIEDSKQLDGIAFRGLEYLYLSVKNQITLM